MIGVRLLVSIRAGAVTGAAVERRIALTRLLRWAAGCLLFAAVYYAAVQGGYAVKLTGAISAVWPPVGLAAGVLYLAGLRWWPGVVLGNLLATDSTLPNVTIIGQTAGNLAEVRIGRASSGAVQVAWWDVTGNLVNLRARSASGSWSPREPVGNAGAVSYTHLTLPTILLV